MTEYLKGSKTAWFWTIIRVWFGWQWLTAGYHKVFPGAGGKPFDATGFIKGAIAKSVPAAPGAKPVVYEWWADFLNSFALPNIKLFNFMVAWGEILVGLALIFGFVTIFAATMGALMNFAFLMSGSSSSNPWNFALSFIFVLVGGKVMGYYGVDYLLMPVAKRWINEKLGGLFGTKVRA